MICVDEKKQQEKKLPPPTHTKTFHWLCQQSTKSAQLLKRKSLKEICQIITVLINCCCNLKLKETKYWAVKSKLFHRVWITAQTFFGHKKAEPIESDSRCPPKETRRKRWKNWRQTLTGDVFYVLLRSKVFSTPTAVEYCSVHDPWY